MAKMDAHHLQRLKEEQEKALIDTDNQLQKWHSFRSDYIALQDRLKTLPQKTTHQVMVPFGSLAFMPGQLVHTNEILVLLGDNYFVERSATQAVDIISRRVQSMDKNIQSLEKQREMLAPRAQITSEMISMASGEGDHQEIVEEYNEEEERLWRERHREYLSQAAQRRQREQADKEKQRRKPVLKKDADFWNRLDQLEQQEERRGELKRMNQGQSAKTETELHNEKERSSDDVDDECTQDDKDQSSLEDSEEPEDEESAADEEDDKDQSSLEDSEEFEDEESAADEEDVTEEEEEVCQVRKVITFSHTKSDSPSSKVSTVHSEDSSDAINSPADLYRLMKMAPKSILKAKPQDTKHRSERKKHVSQAGQEKKVTFAGAQKEGSTASSQFKEHRGPGGKTLSYAKDDATGVRSADGEKQFAVSPDVPRVKAFSDTVVERQTQPQTVPIQPPTGTSLSAGGAASGAQEPSSSNRPVSKFRAARQTQDPTNSDPTAAVESQEKDSPSLPSVSVPSNDASSSSSRPVSRFRAARMKQGGGS